jgi:restriction system protein
MSEFWMVRAGEGGYLAAHFERTSHVAVGFRELGRSFREFKTFEDLRKAIAESEPDLRPGSIAVVARVAWKFAHVLRPGDHVVTYDPSEREYSLGKITGDYEYKPGLIPDYSHVRPVQWEGRVSRDALLPASRNSLGSLVSLFQPGEDVLRDLEAVLRVGHAAPAEEATPPSPEEGFEEVRRDIAERAHEFLKDKVLSLGADDLEELVAAVLRALGYKARVTPKGPDRGRDVIASPDGLGFQSPRVIAEVKHRPKEPIGANTIRSFLGGLREGDRGLFVSTGGFTREAHYEAERASVPVTLVDLDQLAVLIVEHYESFDLDGRSLVPLVRVYWPVS